MRTRSPAVSLVAFGLFGLGALSARSAFADSSCATDADCLKGWACRVTSSSGCGYACPAGQTCAPPPDCPTVETKSCIPGPCQADSDCATGMVCYTTQVGGCDSAPACAPGADCPTPTCATTTQSTCIPRYDAPCTADADCGSGFTCVADGTNCACASGGSVPSADGGTQVDPVPPTNCDCPPATTSSCHAMPVQCTTAADCASGWTCEDVVAPTGCASDSKSAPAPSGGSADGGAPTPTQDAGIDPCPPPPPPMKLCLPPYYSVGGATLGVFASGSNGTPTDSSATGTAGSTSIGAPKAPTGDSNGQNSTAAGCSVAHGASGGASGLALLMLGLFGFARRRRSEQTAR